MTRVLGVKREECIEFVEFIEFIGFVEFVVIGIGSATARQVGTRDDGGGSDE